MSAHYPHPLSPHTNTHTHTPLPRAMPAELFLELFCVDVFPEPYAVVVVIFLILHVEYTGLVGKRQRERALRNGETVR